MRGEKPGEEIMGKPLRGLAKYPEFKALVDQVVYDASSKINDLAPQIKSDMPYKTQFVLEEVIRELQTRV